MSGAGMKSRRFLFVLLLSALVAGALAAGRASSAPPPKPLSAKVASSAAVLTESSTVWFCPGLPPSLPHASGRVTFANIGAATAEVVVTDLADNGSASHVTVEVRARSVVTRA